MRLMMKYTAVMLMMAILAACGANQPPDTGVAATLNAVNQLANATPTLSFSDAIAVTVDGAVNFVPDSVNLQRNADDTITLSFFVAETAQGVTLTFPAITEPTTWTLPDDAVTVFVLGLDVRAAADNPAGLYNLTPSGALSINAVNENTLSGRFDFTVTNSAGETVTAGGEFRDVLFE